MQSVKSAWGTTEVAQCPTATRSNAVRPRQSAVASDNPKDSRGAPAHVALKSVKCVRRIGGGGDCESRRREMGARALLSERAVAGARHVAQDAVEAQPHPRAAVGERRHLGLRAAEWTLVVAERGETDSVQEKGTQAMGKNAGVLCDFTLSFP
eukprot:793085-Pleurochrysis_carterae.AAC.6